MSKFLDLSGFWNFHKFQNFSKVMFQYPRNWDYSRSLASNTAAESDGQLTLVKYSLHAELKKQCHAFVSWNSVHSSSLWSGHKSVNTNLDSTNHSRV